MSFTPVPSLGSLLRGIAIPTVGGDTLFANMYLAYDALSDGMKKLIAGLHGIHSGTRKLDDPNSARGRSRGRSTRRSRSRSCACIPRPAARRSISARR